MDPRAIPAPGGDTGMSNEAISKYLADMQNRACRLSGIMNAIAFLENEDACKEGQATLIYLAEDLAGDLYSALDSVNHPEEVE